MQLLKRIRYNSPVVLTFVLLCVAVMVLGYATNLYTTRMFFLVRRGSLVNPLTYIRLFTHVFGHASWEHLTGNMLYLLLLGPMLEEKYGSKRLAIIMTLTALTTGLCNVICFPHSALLGASGIVFCFIMLASITGEKDTIPLTWIIMMILYIGTQIYDGIFVQDNISQMAHIIGGLVGAGCGFYWRPDRSITDI